MKLAAMVFPFAAWAQIQVAIVPTQTAGQIEVKIAGSALINPAVAQFAITSPPGVALKTVEQTSPGKTLSACQQAGTRTNCVVAGLALDRIAIGTMMRLTYTAACRPLNPSFALAEAVGAGPDPVLVSLVPGADPIRVAWPLVGDLNADGAVSETDRALAISRVLAADAASVLPALLDLIRVSQAIISPVPDCPQ